MIVGSSIDTWYFGLDIILGIVKLSKLNNGIWAFNPIFYA
jgi:hypothetical protein